MSRQHTFRRAAYSTLLLALCLGMFACSAQNTAQQPSPSPTILPNPTPTSTSNISNQVHPSRLLIPALQVDAPVENVGITSNGDLATPTHDPWEGVGWYANGAYPGTKGSSVIDGHLDRPGGSPAVFWFLHNLHAGDTVEVKESNEKILHFRVTDVEFYAPQSAPLQQIFGDSSGKFLNLITCAGDWIPSQKQTTLRLVVYTSLISS
ncbi:MAG TPA: class F sortase [Ktedonobacteraceae bacterium]